MEIINTTLFTIGENKELKMKATQKVRIQLRMLWYIDFTNTQLGKLIHMLTTETFTQTFAEDQQ